LALSPLEEFIWQALQRNGNLNLNFYLRVKSPVRSCISLHKFLWHRCVTTTFHLFFRRFSMSSQVLSTRAPVFLVRAPKGRIQARTTAPNLHEIRKSRFQYSSLIIEMLRDSRFDIAYSGFLSHGQGWNMLLVARGLRILIKKKGFGAITVFVFKKEGAFWTKQEKSYSCDTECSEVLSFVQSA
jgi:hypothetical protein